MSEKEILARLCAYDPRNTEGAVTYMDKEDFEEVQKRVKAEGRCSCDNCFYGRTELANELLKRIASN